MATGVVPEDLLEVGTACREDDLVPLEDCAVKRYKINQRVMVTVVIMVNMVTIVIIMIMVAITLTTRVITMIY